MRRDVFIVRRWNPKDRAGITYGEWIEAIAGDASFRKATVEDYARISVPMPAGPVYVIWTGHPSKREWWFSWGEGRITTNASDEHVLEKMREIAARLNAIIDDGSARHDDDRRFRSGVTFD